MEQRKNNDSWMITAIFSSMATSLLWAAALHLDGFAAKRDYVNQHFAAIERTTILNCGEILPPPSEA
jgi:hypothetical protein